MNVENMDQETATEVVDTSWPELSADLTLARTQARSIMLDTQRANSDGRILELNAQIELMRTRMTSLEQHLFESQTTVPEDLAEHLQTIDEALHAVRARLETFSTRIGAAEEQASTTMLTTVSSMDARIDAVDNARRAQSGEIDELSSYLEQSFTRISELAAIIDANASTQLAHADDLDQVHSQLTALEQSLAALDSRIELAAENVENASAESVAELEAAISAQADRVSINEAELLSSKDRLDQINERLEEQTTTQDEIATTIQFLQSRAQAIESTHNSHASEIVEHVDYAHRRLDEGLGELAKLRSAVEAAEVATPEDLSFLESKLDNHAQDQGEIFEAITEVVQVLDERIAKHDSVLDAHSTILDATTGLLTEHNQIAGSNAAAIADFTDQAAKHDAAVKEALDSIGEVNRRASETADRVEESTQKLDETTQRFDKRFITQDVKLDDLASRLASAEEAGKSTLEFAETASVETERSIDEKASALEGRIDETVRRLDEIEASPPEDSELSERVNRLEPEVENHTEQIDSVNDQIARLDRLVDEAHDYHDITSSRIEAVNDWVTNVDGRINDTQEQIEAINDWVTVVDGRINDTQAQADTTQEQIEAVNDWVTVVDGRISEAQSQASDAQEQIDTLHESSARLDERTSTLEDRSQTTEERLDQLIEEQANTPATTVAEIPHEELNTLTSRIDETTPRLDGHDQQIDAVNNRANTLDERADETEAHAAKTREQVEAVNNRVNAVEGRTQLLEGRSREQVEAVNDRVNALDERTGALEGQTNEQNDAVNNRVNEVHERINETHERTNHLEERTRDIESRAAETAAQLEELAQQRAEVDPAALAAFDASVDSADQVTPRVDTHHRQIEAINDWVTEVDGRVGEILERGDSSVEQFDALNDWSITLDQRILEIQNRADNTGRKVTQFQEWAENATTGMERVNARVDASNNEIKATEERLAVAENAVTEIRGEGEAFQEQLDAVNGWATNLEIRTYEMNTSLEQAQQTIVEMTTQLAALHEKGLEDAGLGEQVNALAAAIAEIETRVEARERSVDPTTLQAQIAASERAVKDTQQSIQGWVKNVESTTQKANNEVRDFMVYRIDTAEDRIDRRLSEIESMSAGAERLEALEQSVAEANQQAQNAHAFSENLRLLQTDLVQAIQAELVVQSEQIARHNQLLMNSGAPANQVAASEPATRETPMNAVALRSDLDIALNRISQLEAKLAKERAEQTTAPSTQVTHPSSPEPSQQDQAWFNNSDE